MGLKAGRVGIHPSQVDPITGMLIGGGPGGASIDDNTISKNTTWSSNKINSELSGKADTSTVSDMYASINENAANILQLATNKADRSDLADVYASINAMALTKLVDVEINDPQDGDYFVYDGTNHKWVNSGSAPAPTYIDVTCTFYGAVEDIISFTDAAGVSHLVTFAANASSKQETFKIDPSGSSITFTSGVAKNPDNLSESYSKTVTITGATTEIWVMPNNVLYWYGYTDNLETCNTTNGWSKSNTSQGFSTPTYNKNSIGILAPGNTDVGVGNTNAITMSKMHMIGSGTDRYYARVAGLASKNLDSPSRAVWDNTNIPFTTSLSYGSVDVSGYSYMCAWGFNTDNVTLHAMWYE